MSKKIQGIYKIINCINNKIYIGQSNNIEHRFKQHKSNSKNKCKHPLYNSINKYGIGNFEFIILEKIKNINELDLRELYWINHYKSNNPNYGYNLRLDCRTNRGYKYSEKLKKQNSEMVKKLWEDPIYRNNMLESRKHSEGKRLKTIENKKLSDPRYINDILEKRKQTRINNGTTKIYSIDRDKVIRLYIDENYELKEVAKIMNLSFGLLAKFLKLNNIKKRKLKVRKAKPSITDEQLHQICDSVCSKI